MAEKPIQNQADDPGDINTRTFGRKADGTLVWVPYEPDPASSADIATHDSDVAAHADIRADVATAQADATQGITDAATAQTTADGAVTDAATAQATADAAVAKAGDTMTGPLVLPGDPTLALQAAPKQYVDAAIGGGVPDGDKGDITVTGGVWSIDAGVVDTAELADGAVTAAKSALDADDIPDAATTNKFTTQAEIDKLAGIEANATADQTAAEIKTAYESNADTNAFTDADVTALAAAAVKAEATVTVDAGATASTARPTGWGHVQWIVNNGVTPTNAAAGDLIFERSA